MLEFDVKITDKDLYDYMTAHSYNSAPGILGSCVGGLMVVVALLNGHWFYLICGIILLLYLPLSLRIKSKQQIIKNAAFQKPLHYTLDDEGITISQGEESQSQKWEDMYKAISTSRSIIVYTSKVSATIFPRTQMGEDTVKVIEMISTHMPPKKVKIRY